MDKTRQHPISTSIKGVANDHDVAIAFVDESGREVATFNNNSICRSLNPDGEFSPACARYCGRAAQTASEKHSLVRFECHAGLQCQALPVRVGEREMSAIVGRAFTESEKYRAVTEKALSGEWQRFPIDTFFENVLLLTSTLPISSAIGSLRKLQSKKTVSDTGERTTAVDDTNLKKTDPPETKVDDEHLTYLDAQSTHAWRSFFGSLLDSNYNDATKAILDFLATQYGLNDLVWLESKEGGLESTHVRSSRGFKLRTAISKTDERLLQALSTDGPLILTQRSTRRSSAHAKLSVFPIGLVRQVSAAVGILDVIDDPNTVSQISRLCHSISSQLEILRLRSQVDQSKELSLAIRRFGSGLKNVATEDLWLTLTQKAAELLKAERASLVTYSRSGDGFALKAMIGSPVPFKMDQRVDGQITRLVFEKNKALAVTDLSKANLPPAPAERQYKSGSFLSCPVSIGGVVTAVMNFTDPADSKTFDKDSIELFRAIAPQIAVAIDRADLKEKAGEFEQLSVTDPLTGLLNRRYLEERLTEETKRSNRHGYPMSFMMVDVDQFKSYNDKFGHPAGDVALKLVGHIIRETLRSADVAARYGGEEFSILLPQTTGEEAEMIAERLRSNIQNAEFPHREVTVSIGVASCSADLCVYADLMSAADKALYRAKNGGRNRVIAYRDETPVVSTRHK
jgi:diguanylate cyclase (GGDEF)-like protein